MIDTIHILGNGPSISLFNRDDWPSEHEFIGCNFSNTELCPDYTVIVDVKPIMKLFEGYKLSIPAVISDRCVKYIEKDNGGWRKLASDAINVIDTIEMIHKNGWKYPMNSGHHATLYGIKKHGHELKTIYLWGFDSFWTHDISSSSDVHFRNSTAPRIREPVTTEWRKYWNEIMKEHSSINFIIKENVSEKL
jgi:hypothetical protein